MSLGLTATEGRATPTTSVLDVSSSGALANNTTSYQGSISANGRYVAFASQATNLSPGATDGGYHAYLRDRATGQTTQIDVGPSGVQASSGGAVEISADGRYVAFIATGSGLVPGVSGTALYRYDRVTGTLIALPAPPAGYTPVLVPSISADGSRIAYEAETAADRADVFWWNAATGGTTQVDETANGTPLPGGGANPAISADGSHLAFTAASQNFVSGNSPGEAVVAEQDLSTGALTEVSLGVSGAQPNNPSYSPSVDGNGCVVAFISTANNLVAGVSGSSTRLYVRDVCAATTELASVTPNGAPATDGTSSSSISSDGCRIVFPTSDAVSPPQPSSDGLAIALRDRCAGSTTRLDVTTNGQPSDGYANGGYISGGTGRYVVFASASNVLLGGTGTGPYHLFVRDIDTNTAPTAELTVSTSGSTVTADASGSSDPDGYNLQTTLSFGDGSAVQTEAHAVHTYAGPGSYIVTATVTDSDGASSSTTALVTIAAATGTAPGGGIGSVGAGGTTGGGGSGGGSAGRLTNPLTIARAALTRRRFAVISGSHPVDATHGSQLVIRVNEAATLTATFERRTIGHRSRGRCRTTAGASGSRCETYVAVGTLTRRVLAGTSRIPLTGTVGDARLAAGRYRLLVAAHLRGGRPTPTRSLAFTIEPSAPATAPSTAHRSER